RIIKKKKNFSPRVLYVHITQPIIRVSYITLTLSIYFTLSPICFTASATSSFSRHPSLIL
ncbi:hypothetical protein, partial [Burkholderia sp. Ac-20392]|uniref:hypothetical protein n=1 Tax=Burkholderia sp. Ac-20392 TaxID=2703905 RepID=UPI00198223CF